MGIFYENHSFIKNLDSKYKKKFFETDSETVKKNFESNKFE